MRLAPSLLLCLLLGAPWAEANARTAAHEAVVARVCRSADPVLVIDNFPGDPTNEPIMDLDGDGSYDIYHGELVAQLVGRSGQKVIRHNVGQTLLPVTLTEILNSYAARIEKGELRLSWINFSKGFAAEFDDINSELRLRPRVSHLDVFERRQEILEKFWTTMPRLKPLKGLSEAFERLGRLGVPVVAAGTNSMFRAVNLYSLFPNVITVGALSLDGRKAGYSADNSAVTIWRRGTLVSRLAEGGVDLDGDGRADFHLAARAVPAELLADFQGRHVKEVLSEVPEAVDREHNNNTSTIFELTAKLPKGLYDTRALLKRALLTGLERERYMGELGDVLYLDGESPLPLFFAKISTSGKLVIRQGVEQGGLQFRNHIEGTSFASPLICNGETTPEKYAL